MEIRYTGGGRRVGIFRFQVEKMAACWRLGIKTVMYCSNYEIFNPFISKEYLEALEERASFGPDEFSRLLEGSWDTEEGN